MNNIKIFESPIFGKVRTTEINGEPYFVGKDVAEILGYKETAKVTGKGQRYFVNKFLGNKEEM